MNDSGEGEEGDDENKREYQRGKEGDTKLTLRTLTLTLTLTLTPNM